MTMRSLYEHNLWANLALIDACTKVGPELMDKAIDGTYGTPRATLQHLVGAEARYVSRLQGTPPTEPLEAGEFPGFDALRARANASGRALIDLCESVPPGRVFESNWDGESYRISCDLVKVQAINHATEHRAHIVTTLSTFGVEPAQLDGWSWGFTTGGITPAS